MSTLQCAPNTAVSRHATPTCAQQPNRRALRPQISRSDPLALGLSHQILSQQREASKICRNGAAGGGGAVDLMGSVPAAYLQVGDAVLVGDGRELAQRRPEGVRRARHRQRHLDALDARGVHLCDRSPSARALAACRRPLVRVLACGQRSPARSRAFGRHIAIARVSTREGWLSTKCQSMASTERPVAGVRVAALPFHCTRTLYSDTVFALRTAAFLSCPTCERSAVDVTVHVRVQYV